MEIYKEKTKQKRTYPYKNKEANQIYIEYIEGWTKKRDLNGIHYISLPIKAVIKKQNKTKKRPLNVKKKKKKKRNKKKHC